MKYSLLKLAPIVLVVAAAALVVSIACGSSDEEAAPTPDVARIIQDAVSSVPQGASAAEIQSWSRTRFRRRLPVSRRAFTRADVEAAVNSASAGQLSAAEVQRIVDQSIRDFPIPEPERIDLTQLQNLIHQSVAELVPEGVSAAEINRMVTAAVGPCRPERLRAVTWKTLSPSPSMDVAADQLTAAQVQDIVAASQAATQAAVDASLAATQSALDASLMQTQSSVDASLMQTQSTVEEAAMAAKGAREAAEKAASEAAMAIVEPVQPYGKPLGVGGYFDFRFTGRSRQRSRSPRCRRIWSSRASCLRSWSASRCRRTCMSSRLRTRSGHTAARGGQRGTASAICSSTPTGIRCS